MQSSDLRTPSALSAVPPRQRRQLALLVGPVAAVLLVAGVLLGWQAGSAVGHGLGAVIAICAAGLLAIAHGLYWSARADLQEQRLDEAILATAGACGACGVDDCAVKALPRS